jgi:uncharacterized membrane protein
MAVTTKSHELRESSRALGVAAGIARTFCGAGLVVGTLFFALSLTPSLLPRSAFIQGFVSGLSFAVGYALGALGRSVWRYLELPTPSNRVTRAVRLVMAAVCVLTAAFFLWRASAWQDSIRALMDMAPSEGARPFMVGLLAGAIFAVVLLVARLFGLVSAAIARFLARYVPKRVSLLVGVLAAAVLFWSIVEGVSVHWVLSAVDTSFQQVDALMEPEREQPHDWLRSGSPESAVNWEDLGRAGREFIAGGPTRANLRAFFGEDVAAPIRVYVGLNSAETVAERSRLALEELERTGAFDRSMLVVITPTGTGWVDPSAIDTLEYLQRGDVASVTVQYSYLASMFALLLEPDRGAETAQALFADVYGHWTQLPHEHRPALYLHGLSLGALHSDHSFSVYDVMGDTFQGVLWSGPPFRSETWRRATERRVPGSPAWLPRFRDSTVIRFTDQHDRLNIAGVPWGPLRIAFLQYASDPITFFEPSMAYRPPEWLAPPRGADVTPELRWIPIVTMLQVMFDMRGGDITPLGHGHNIAPADYIDAWRALTEPAGWTEPEIERLKALFATRGAEHE